MHSKSSKPDIQKQVLVTVLQFLHVRAYTLDRSKRLMDQTWFTTDVWILAGIIQNWVFKTYGNECLSVIFVSTVAFFLRMWWWMHLQASSSYSFTSVLSEAVNWQICYYQGASVGADSTQNY